MSTEILKINKNTVLPLDMVRFVSPLGEEEQTRISDKLGIDGNRFHTRLTMADGASQLACESVSELQQQVGFVDLGNERFVPAANILLAREFTNEQEQELKAKGYHLATTYRSSIETRAGVILSSAYPNEVMERRATALERRALAGRKTEGKSARTSFPSPATLPSPDGTVS